MLHKRCNKFSNFEILQLNFSRFFLDEQVYFNAFRHPKKINFWFLLTLDRGPKTHTDHCNNFYKIYFTKKAKTQPSLCGSHVQADFHSLKLGLLPTDVSKICYDSKTESEEIPQTLLLQVQTKGSWVNIIMHNNNSNNPKMSLQGSPSSEATERVTRHPLLDLFDAAPQSSCPHAISFYTAYTI